MQLIKGISQLSVEHRPSVATIGNFDGVHAGHEIVIGTLLTASERLNLPATVITFDPLAKEHFAPESALRLQPLGQRVERLFTLGVEQVLVIDFNEELAAYSPTKFVQEVLVGGLGIAYLSVGDDFRFGHQRAGDFDFLLASGLRYGFEVVAHDTVNFAGNRISSGRLRDAVQAGDFQLAEQLLGRPYCISGVVSHGEQRGRTIGFPTANIVLDAARFAVQGVYAVRVHVPTSAESDAEHLKGANVIEGVANAGMRPTVAGTENRLEVHLFDFDQDLYGSELKVEFVSKVRDEQKFDSFDALKTQIGHDVIVARDHLAAMAS